MSDSEDEIVLPNREKKFPDGSILKIVFKNFLTYDHAELTPGENLNLIIGTNGSGKSSIICGICLAVGGSPKVLGRSERHADYIKHGTDEGSVELYIEDNGKDPQRMQICLFRSGNCEYRINGKKSTQKEIRELAAFYNIQIDNPCTFLAQDKVKSFSEQNPVDLLRNTEKAGNPKLLAEHEDLISKRKDFLNMKTAAGATERRLKEVSTEIEQLEPRVKNYYARQNLDMKINIFKQKLAVISYNEESDKCIAKREAHDEKQAEVEKLKKKVANCANSIDKFENQMKEVVRRFKTANREFHDIENELEDKCHPDFYNSRIQAAKDKLDNVRSASDDYDADLEKLRKEIEDLEAKLVERKEEMNDEMAVIRNAQNARHKLDEERDELDSEAGTFSERERQLRAELYGLREKRSSHYTAYEDRLNHMRNNNIFDVVEAWQWITNNENRFEHPIYIPLIHISVSIEHAHLLDNAVPFRDSVMFICGSQRDESELAHYFPKINTAVVDPNSVNLADIEAQLPSRLQQLGFNDYFVNFFTAPDVVKQYLCNIYQLHRIPVGGDAVNRNYNEVVDLLPRHNMRVFFTRTERCEIKISKYSQELLITNSALRPARLYAAHTKPIVDQNEYIQAKMKIEAKQREFVKARGDWKLKLENVEAQIAELGKYRDRYKKMNAAVLSLEGILGDTRKRYERKCEFRPDIKSAEAAYEEAKEQASMVTLNLAKKFAEQMERMASLWAEKKLLTEFQKKIDAEIDKLKEKERKSKLESQEKQLDLETLVRDFETAKQRLRQARHELRDECQLTTLDVKKMVQREADIWKNIQESFEQFGVTNAAREEVMEKLEEEKATKRLGGGNGSKEDVVHYKKLTEERTSLTEEAAASNKTLENFTTKFTKDIEQWKNPLLQLVDAINVNYVKFFNEIGCVGEVQLEEPDDPLDVEKYGIMIMVSFRSTERVRRLDHQVQSGGERSVSTMLYLLALQELCPVPFRCVDEINQGMDPTNERKVFDIMVKTLTGDGSLAKTQYFLLTPKLLHGLNFNEKVTIQVVHNSRSLSSKAYKWRPAGMLETAA